MTNSGVHVLPLVLGLLAAPAFAAGGDKLYAVNSSDAVIRQVDPVTLQTIASATMSAPSVTISLANGLATHPLTGEVFVLLTISGTNARQLGKVVPATGAVTLLGSTGDRFAGIAFGPSGTLYGITGKGATTVSTLYSLNQSTGQATFVRTCSGGDYGEAIASDPAANRLLRISGDTVQVFESIDLSTLVATQIGLAGDHIAEALSITHIAGDNYFVVDLNDSVFVLNTTGLAKQVGVLGSSYAKGLAFTKPVTTAAYLNLYGTGYPAGFGFVPALCAGGSSAPSGNLTLGIFNAPPATVAVLTIGLAQATLQISPTCVLQNMPVIPTTVVLNLGGTNPGEGSASVTLTVPPGTPPADIYFQAVAIEGSLNLIATNPIQVHIQ